MDIGYTESIPMNQPCRSNNAAARISLDAFESRSACDSTGARDELATRAWTVISIYINHAPVHNHVHLATETLSSCEHRTEQTKAN